MKKISTLRISTAWSLVIILLLALPMMALAQEHQHDHGAAIPDMDAEGKRLESYQVKHQMDDETLAALRAKIALYRGMTDREVNMNMSGMGPNYEWYVSDPALNGDIGVLILSHGVGENSDRMMKEAMAPIATERPTAIGFGMAMMSSSHLQSAVDDLVARGATTIVLVQNGVTTEYNSLTRQWKYIFNLGEESTYLEVPPIKADGVRFVMTPPLGDSPIITEILYDHAKEVSKNPSNEFLMIVGHGPEDIEDNIPDLETISMHADRIRAKNEFADVKIINLQDDAIPPIRKSNVKKLRRWIQKADDDGLDVIVVAITAASYGVQQHIIQDLRGLNYTFAEKGLAEHPRFVEFLEAQINETVAGL
jgi:hypothetical protein